MQKNRNLSRAAVSISVLSLVMPTAASADNHAFASQMQGTWKGNYTCSGKTTGVSIYISDKSIDQDGNRRAVFSFYSLINRSGPKGSFKGTMTFWGDKSITFSPAYWIDRFQNYEMIGFRALSSPQRNKMQGFVQASGCGQIEIEKVGEFVPEIYIEAMDGAKPKPPETVGVAAPVLPKTLPATDGTSKAVDTGVKPKALAQLPSTAIHPSDPPKALAVPAAAPMKVSVKAAPVASQPNQPEEVTPAPANASTTLKLRDEMQREADNSKPTGEMSDSERKLQEALSWSKNSAMRSTAKYSAAELAAMPDFQREAILKDAGTSREDGISDEEKGRRQEKEMALASAEDAKVFIQPSVRQASMSIAAYQRHIAQQNEEAERYLAPQSAENSGQASQYTTADAWKNPPKQNAGDNFVNALLGLTAVLVVESIKDYNSLTPAQKAIRDKEVAEDSRRQREQSSYAPPPQTMYEMERDNKTVECFVTMGDAHGC